MVQHPERIDLSLDLNVGKRDRRTVLVYTVVDRRGVGGRVICLSRTVRLKFEVPRYRTLNHN